MKVIFKWRGLARWVGLAVALSVLAACRVAGDSAPGVPLTTTAEGVPPSLKTVSVPGVGSLGSYIKNEAAAVALGKALFWEQATGSDGLACASCHFHAGADNRIKNQLHPGFDWRFARMASGRKGGPNDILAPADFPLHKFTNPDDRNSPMRFDTNDVVGSQGVFNGRFISASENPRDACERAPESIFHVTGVGTRKTTDRNSPSAINAALNFRNFWDGRANNAFNGVDPFGLRNAQATVLISDGPGTSVRPHRVDLRNSSLASQGDGPAVSDVEMICNGRTFASLGRKLIPRYALSLQSVHPSDSVLGPYRATEAGVKGLSVKYEDLIKLAFKDEFWNADAVGDIGNYTQMENNFSLFWGLALQLYQSTLVSDDAPYDRFAEGRGGLNAAQLGGLEVFLNKGRCINCHKGPEFSGAASTLQAEYDEGGLVERMVMADGGVALYDNGFYNIGVTRTSADLGVGGRDPFGNPLSFSRQYTTGRFVDPVRVDPCTFEVPFGAADCAAGSPNLAGERTAVNGAFKTPILRNVELTGPYFHDGSSATLEQVVKHYNRGGNFQNPELDPDVTPLGLSPAEEANLVAFMKTLTDERVRYERAPFDHPQLYIPNGHPGNQNRTQGGEFGQANMAVTEWLEVPAVGSGGRGAPLRDFATTLRTRSNGLRLVQPFDPDNTPPVLNPLPDRVSAFGASVAERFTAVDPNGNRIFYSASGLPTGLRLGVNGLLTGRLRERGEFVVTLMAYDQQLGTTTTTFTWTVN